ncbi:glycosyltransferase [Bdellovibrio sp. 22V]|uniref:glycosyltransferase n=1 Tax=Bdellovibrio sp. 22V TaxID=3044166 RepID=UPI002543DD24|nr:glycosyltransferase [Bdellovibrio sp. 22V]WII73634.1 glycosyltransferase [Bdellovibrio sp. 22V]
MESSVSTPHCSFVVYLNRDSALVPDFLKDVRSFFQKFPLSYELIFAVENNASACSEILQPELKNAGPKETLVLLQNTKTRGRAESLRHALHKAQAPFVLVATVEMATPLGDLFKILQHLMTEPDVDICWGDRTSRKDSPFQYKREPRHRIEHTFNAITREKNRQPFKDPSCEIWGIKKTAWSDIGNSSPTHPWRGWYTAPYVQNLCRKLNKSVVEVPVYDSGATSPSYSLWKERLNLLTKGVF